MSDDLYNEAIIREAKEGGRTPRLAQPDASVTRDNPLCGDRVTIDVKLEGGAVRELGQKTRGCLLNQAAAALLARRGASATPAELRAVGREIEALLRGEEPALTWPELGMFRPVSRIKSRHECVLLPFEALCDAVEQAEGSGA